MDLRPNSQDTSAFYLGNIYGVLADPNATRPSPIAKPPPFSRPRYSVWVNSLWFLSLVMSLSCALWATSLHQWARRYIRLTQPAGCSPEKRARMRAFFANGVDKMHIPWAVEGLPALLHLSLFLFLGGLAIFLFNIDHEVFICVVLWIGLFSVVYILITMLPLIRHDSPYYTPLSILAWFSYAIIRYATLLSTRSRSPNTFEADERYRDLWNRYRSWILEGMEKTAATTASEPSSDVDIGILDWTLGALDDDNSLEKFFEAIPGFFNSKLVKDLRERLPEDISRRLSNALDGFWRRTLSSNSVVDKVKVHRLDIYLSATNLLPEADVSSILFDILFDRWDQAPQTVAMGRTLACRYTSLHESAARYAQGIISRVLVTVRERDGLWVELAARLFDLPECDVRKYVTHGDDSVSLAILIQITRKEFSTVLLWDSLKAFTRFDMSNAFSGLQRDFCKLWNELVQEAKNQPRTFPVRILRSIRHLYIPLHQGTDAAPTAFSPSTDSLDRILSLPSSYPLCNIPSHCPDSIAHLPVPVLIQPAHSPDASPGYSTSGLSTVNNAVAGPRSLYHPTTPSEIGDSSPATTTTLPALPVHTPPRPSDASPPGAVVASLQDIRATATLSHPLEGTTQRDVVVSSTELDISSPASITASTPTLLSVPVSNLNTGKSSESYDADPASAFKSSLPVSSLVGFPIPASSPLSRAPLLPNAEPLSLLGSTTPSRPTGDATLPRLHARGLVNTGSMCFANAVLQLLVHSPSFWNLFKELGGLKGQREVGSPETGASATPLVDATMRFLEEFVFKEEPPPPQQDAGRKLREDEDATREHNAVDSFEATYMYDAMKEKSQLKDLLVRSRDQIDQDARFCY